VGTKEQSRAHFQATVPIYSCVPPSFHGLGGGVELAWWGGGGVKVRRLVLRTNLKQWVLLKSKLSHVIIYFIVL
jgi:hypothetical protein